MSTVCIELQTCLTYFKAKGYSNCNGIFHLLQWYCVRWIFVSTAADIMNFLIIGIDTNIEVIVVSSTTWEAHHSPRAKPEGCGELPRSLMRQQWLKLRYQFLFYHGETKLMMNKQILSIQMLKFVPKLSLAAAWLHVHIMGPCDLIVSPW